MIWLVFLTSLCSSIVSIEFHDFAARLFAFRVLPWRNITAKEFSRIVLRVFECIEYRVYTFHSQILNKMEKKNWLFARPFLLIANLWAARSVYCPTVCVYIFLVASRIYFVYETPQLEHATQRITEISIVQWSQMYHK